MEEYKNVKGKLLRRGYTSGSCAAAATQAALSLLLQLKNPDSLKSVEIDLPGGQSLYIPIAHVERGEDWAEAAVEKDAGDDPDVTDKLWIYARVSLLADHAGIQIEGGKGVGRVTQPGLDQPVGQAAINSVPRSMIQHEAAKVLTAARSPRGVSVLISVPGGEAVAAKTFNPRLGIVGGISILGTSGIVDPMSHEAIRDTIRVEVRQIAARKSKNLIITPGNYGKDYCQNRAELTGYPLLICSNWIGDAIDTALAAGIERILLVGHIGKLVKLSLGSPNTHSDMGDGRIEALIYAGLKAGASLETLSAMADTVMTDAALELLQSAGCLEPSMQILGERIQAFLDRRALKSGKIAFICFTKSPNITPSELCSSRNLSQFMEEWV